ncbi:hypothetical protein J5TS1_31910 [Bacillus licheniformis]|nr:hypothetical protein BaDB11_00153 [Bacillus licheniformis]GIN35688.1 hypothetical protein J5TS1_31910 [Bacillus licheniformis]
MIRVKVVIGSIILLLIIGFGVWLMLSPTFSKIGDKASKLKNVLEDDKNE